MRGLPRGGAPADPRRAARGHAAPPLRELRPLPVLAGSRLTRGRADAVLVYCDGACSGNPGPGGWGAVIIDGSGERELAGSDADTTNQRMELAAALEALRAVSGQRRVRLHSDSAYVIGCFRQGWWQTWERTGWRNSKREPVANRDLWEGLLAEARRHDVEWIKVAGHSGDPLNERADRLARGAIVRGR